MRLEDLIEQNYHKLSANELYIWEYIRQHPAECRTISIDQLCRSLQHLAHHHPALCQKARAEGLQRT